MPRSFWSQALYSLIVSVRAQSGAAGNIPSFLAKKIPARRYEMFAPLPLLLAAPPLQTWLGLQKAFKPGGIPGGKKATGCYFWREVNLDHLPQLFSEKSWADVVWHFIFRQTNCPLPICPGTGCTRVVRGFQKHRSLVLTRRDASCGDHHRGNTCSLDRQSRSAPCPNPPSAPRHEARCTRTQTSPWTNSAPVRRGCGV